jgi:hypothetical protein
MLSKFYLVLGVGMLLAYALTAALGVEFGDPAPPKVAAIGGPRSGGHGWFSGFGGGK